MTVKAPKLLQEQSAASTTAGKAVVQATIVVKEPEAKKGPKKAEKKTETVNKKRKNPKKATSKKTIKKVETEVKAEKRGPGRPRKDVNIAEASKDAKIKKKVDKAKKRVKKADKAKKSAAHFFEIGGEQISTLDIEAKIQQAYVTEGHKLGYIKSLSIYYNFDEHKAYYVINNKAEGKFVEF